ncbi:hypothetical protein RND71_038453 [Anisodus tanguticus]|uniref:Uncharacterized protein n=1 Tax=Anisodus tanguticus TaxID=243964 RepID=A0AAE1UTI5_9SOLA|nr:hypothetical protein RND71_038453 [Anisodus tanguticus]
MSPMVGVCAPYSWIIMLLEINRIRPEDFCQTFGRCERYNCSDGGHLIGILALIPKFIGSIPYMTCENGYKVRVVRNGKRSRKGPGSDMKRHARILGTFSSYQLQIPVTPNRIDGTMLGVASLFHASTTLTYSRLRFILGLTSKDHESSGFKSANYALTHARNCEMEQYWELEFVSSDSGLNCLVKESICHPISSADKTANTSEGNKFGMPSGAIGDLIAKFNSLSHHHTRRMRLRSGKKMNP